MTLKISRQAALNEAVASLRIEGLNPNAANTALLQAWADGRVSRDAVIAKVTKSVPRQQRTMGTPRKPPALAR